MKTQYLTQTYIYFWNQHHKPNKFRPSKSFNQAKNISPIFLASMISRVIFRGFAPRAACLKMRYVSTLCRLSQTPRHIYIFGISTSSPTHLDHLNPLTRQKICQIFGNFSFQVKFAKFRGDKKRGGGQGAFCHPPKNVKT